MKELQTCTNPDPPKLRIGYETWLKLSYCTDEMLEDLLNNVLIPNQNFELASVVTSLIKSRRD